MNYERVGYEVEDGVATITLNFPEKRNVLRVPISWPQAESQLAAARRNSRSGFGWNRTNGAEWVVPLA